MGKVKVAVATKGSKGVGDEVSDFFAKAETFTLATIEGKRAHIEVIKNPAANLPRGRGRAVVQMLKDNSVDTVVASEFGLGSSALLEHYKINQIVVKAGTRVGDVIRDKLYKKRRVIHIAMFEIACILLLSGIAFRLIILA